MSNAGEDVELQEVSFIAVGNAEWHSHFGRHRHFLIKLNTLLPRDPAIMLFGIYPKEFKTCPYKNLHTDVSSSLLYNCQYLKATKASFSRRMCKYTMVNPANGILFSANEKWGIKPWEDMEKPLMHTTK